MPYEVRIRFHGVVGYVESCDQKQVALFLPKAGRRVVPNQVAYVKFPVSAYVEGRRLADPDPDAPRGMGHVELKRERVRFETGEPQPLEIDKKCDRFGSKTPTSATDKSLRWVPDLDDLSCGHGRIDPAFLRKNPRKARPRLIARVDLETGSLATTGVDPVQVPFDTSGGGSNAVRRMPIAREFLLTLTLKQRNFVLRTQRFNDEAAHLGDLHFRVPDDGLEIVIGNESRADIYKEVLPIQPVDTLARACMAEFRFYYRMCADNPKNGLVPYLSSRPGSETCCSGARFRPEAKLELDSDDSNAITLNVEKPKWTMLAYLAADNSLSGIAADDIDKLEEGDGVGVVAQVDRTNRPTERLMLEDEGFVLIDKLDDNLNAGDPQVLTDFLTKGQAVRPADNFAVFILSHGAGLLDFTFQHTRPKPGCSPRSVLKALWGRLLSLPRFRSRRIKFLDLITMGMGPDVTSGDYLDNQELVRGLRNALGPNEKFAIIGFDACVMALAEMAFELCEVGQFLVASQDDVNIDGCPYNKILKRMAPVDDPKTAVEIIVDEYGKETKKDQYATLSGIRLDAMPIVVAALNKLGEHLLDRLKKGDLDKLAYARNGARVFSNFYYIDLLGYARSLSVNFSDRPEVVGAAANVESAVRNAVICTNTNVKEYKSKQAHGLSIYLPDTRLERVESLYDKLAIAKDLTTSDKPSQWRNFVFAYSKAR